MPQSPTTVDFSDIFKRHIFQLVASLIFLSKLCATQGGFFVAFSAQLFKG
jgi:hypothetical protein